MTWSVYLDSEIDDVHAQDESLTIGEDSESQVVASDRTDSVDGALIELVGRPDDGLVSPQDSHPYYLEYEL